MKKTINIKKSKNRNAKKSVKNSGQTPKQRT